MASQWRRKYIRARLQGLSSRKGVLEHGIPESTVSKSPGFWEITKPRALELMEKHIWEPF